MLYDDAHIRDILQSVKTIAIVGASPKPDRDSHIVLNICAAIIMTWWRLIQVMRGEKLQAFPVSRNLQTFRKQIDMVDIFGTQTQRLR